MPQTDSYNSFLGRGWSFPPTFDKSNRQVVMVEDVEDIRQSMQILLSTSLRERVMQPEYGCNLTDLLYEPVNASLIAYIKDLVETAILYHEPRIEVQEIELKTDQVNEGLILIAVDYVIRSTNSRFNFVYPFYLEEGREI